MGNSFDCSSSQPPTTPVVGKPMVSVDSFSTRRLKDLQLLSICETTFPRAVSNGTWFVQGLPDVVWGQQGDIAVPGDYDGDGVEERAVWRPSNGNWYNQKTSPPVHWGEPGDIPVPGDYAGVGRLQRAVWRPST